MSEQPDPAGCRNDFLRRRTDPGSWWEYRPTVRESIVAFWLLVVTIIASIAIGRGVSTSSKANHTADRVASQQAQILSDQRQRVRDQRAACRVGSKASVKDIEVNWVDYLTNAKLAREGSLGRGFSTELSSIFSQRADINREAALAKAHRVQRSDAHLVRYVSLRHYVVKADFSCDQRYPFPRVRS